MQMPGWMPEPGSPLDRIATFLMANLVWGMLAVLIVPLPAATAGLFATFAPWVRSRDTEFFSVFFGTMRRQWLKSSLIGVADLVIFLILYINFQAMNLMNQDDLFVWVLRSLNVFVAVTVLMTNLYIWPLLVLFDLPLKRLFGVSARLALAHPLWSLILLIVVVAIAFVGLILPVFLTVLVVFSAIALVVNWGAWRIIRKYATPEELAELNQPGS